MFSRRHLLLGLCGAAGVGVAARWGIRSPRVAAGACQELAGRRIRWVVPNAAGGGYDAESRLVEPYYERRLGAEIYIDNIPGAGGIIGARTITAAPPDGLTLGIIGVPGLLVAALTGETPAPNPATDFTVLGRLGRSWHVWATAGHSPFASIHDVLLESRRRPIVFSINEAGSASFVSITVSAALLGVPADLVAGFSGTRNSTLAVVRGEVDMICLNFETIADLVETGDLRPLLQVSDHPISQHPALEDVPLLGGRDGLAVSTATTLQRDVAAAEHTVQTLIDVVGTGRVVVAPPNMSPELSTCLESGLADALGDPAFQAAAGERLDFAPAASTRAGIAAAARAGRALMPLVQDAMRKIRQ